MANSKRPNLSLPIEPYDALREVEPDLYVVDGDWRESRFRRRMTIMRTRGGELVIHNPIRLEDHDYAGLESLGLVAHIVAPNAFHDSDGAFYRTRFPLARFYAPGEIASAWPHALRKEVDYIPVGGLRFVKETVFFHTVSKTLVVTDLVFNMHCRLEGLEKFLYLLNGIYGRFGPSRLFRYGFISDKTELGRAIANMLRWDFERVIMNHGDILERDGPARIREAFAEIGVNPVLHA